MENKKYVLIQNEGEIEVGSFELIGASTKRNDNTKIGFFGSGLKYSIAYMLRNKIDFRVFSGLREIRFDTETVCMRGQDFERVCINGVPTSFTTTMGPTWNEPWFVFREIYCNALDESGCTIIKNTESINQSEGRTRIYIEITKELENVINNFDAYFTDDRTTKYIFNDIKTPYIDEWKNGYNGEQPVKVYNKTDGVIFRKGIRVYSSSKLMYDYCLENISINEDRTMKSPHYIKYAISCIIAEMRDINYVKSVLRSYKLNQNEVTTEFDSLYYSEGSTFSYDWIEFSKENNLIVLERSGNYSDMISTSKKECFFLPMNFASKLKKTIDGVFIFGIGGVVGDITFEDVEPSNKHNYLINDVSKQLAEMGYNINYHIKVVSFSSRDTLGMSDFKNNQILISNICLDLGRREIAMTLIEEQEHLDTKFEDETRKFQNHLFSLLLKSMENSSGIFL